MTSLPARPRVAVIGAGILGVSTALELVRLGADVTLVTEGAVASQASGRSLSWLNSSRRRSATYHALRVLGIDRYRTLAWNHPGADWLRFDGGLTWDPTGDGNEIADAFAHERQLGYDARLLAADEIAAVTPGVDASLVTPEGAIFNPGEGWVDLPSLIAVLLDEYTAAGGTLLVDAGKATIDIENGRVTGVSTETGTRIDVDAAVLAAGAAVPGIVAELGVHIGDASPIALLVKTTPGDYALRAVLNTPRVAVRPTPDGALVLDSAWSEEEVVVRDDGTFEIAESTVAGLLAEASAVLEGNPELHLESYGVGPKPIPGDGEPVFGELEGVAGYFVAFSHSGATLGLIAGELLASEVVSGQPHPLLADFRPARFQVPVGV
jgi:glycine/D-amino acid oxidase-like deaminating enzyme